MADTKFFDSGMSKDILGTEANPADTTLYTASLETENANLKKENATLKFENAILETKVKELTEENESLQVIRNSLQKQLAQALSGGDTDKEKMVERLLHDILTDRPDYFSQVELTNAFKEASGK